VHKRAAIGRAKAWFFKPNFCGEWPALNGQFFSLSVLARSLAQKIALGTNKVTVHEFTFCAEPSPTLPHPTFNRFANDCKCQHFAAKAEYHTSISPRVCSWCLMAYSWGFTSSNYYPPSLSAWSKANLQFVAPIDITESGTYTIASQQDNPQVSFTSASGLIYKFCPPIHFRKKKKKVE
jgi:hypothetical protein